MSAAQKAEAAQIIESLLTLSKLDTMRGIYERIAPRPDGRIRTVLSVVGTETGRLSHSESFVDASTNLGNLPKKTAMLDELYNVRRCLVPDEGYTLIEGDLKQAEALATACFSEDDALLQRMLSGEDIHIFTAAHIFGIEAAAVTKEQRYLGKVARHALNYGMGWKRFLAEVNTDADLTGVAISAAQAKRIVDAYHRLHPKLRRWWGRVEGELNRVGYLVNPFGRRRDFFGRGGHETVKEAVAFMPQSTIADYLNIGLAELYEKQQRCGFELLLQIHDAVLVQCPKAKAKYVGYIMRQTLERSVNINDREVVIAAEISTSEESWGTMRRAA